MNSARFWGEANIGPRIEKKPIPDHEGFQMKPVFLVFTRVAAPRLSVAVNVAQIQYVEPMQSGGGSQIYFSDSSQVNVYDPLDEVLRKIRQATSEAYA